MNERPFKILIVDDEDDVRDVLVNYLTRKLHVAASAVDDGVKAVDVVRSLKPDLVLLDGHMPGMMGWEVLREVRKFDRTVKVIIITAIFAVPPEDQEFILQETAGYLAKPVEPQDICAKIIEVMGPEAVKA